MIFQHTFEKVLAKQKTQTRRIVKWGQYAWGNNWVHNSNLPNAFEHWHGYGDIECSNELVTIESVEFDGRVQPVYAVGKTYAVQPGRGKKAVGRIRIKAIRREDVRDISFTDIQAEGFNNYINFMKIWCSMHDKSFDFKTRLIESKVISSSILIPFGREIIGLKDRPAHLYDAWVLEFEVIE